MAVIRVVDVYGLREPIVYSKIGMLESNGAVECLSNIIKENKDRTWTILSANDELRMMDKHGYHYETLDLLKDMKKILINVLRFQQNIYIYMLKKHL